MMVNVWIYTLLSVTLVSLISFVGIFTLTLGDHKLKHSIIYLVSFSAGALFGDVFIHLLPQIAVNGISVQTSLFLLSGIVISFVLEKIIHWRHCHIPITKNHLHRFAYMNLFGDSVHNFIDGVIIAASFLVNIQVGIATTIAIVLHEIPQEMGDFGVLIHGGFTKKKALLYNFLTALTAIAGSLIALLLSNTMSHVTAFLVPFAAGSFLYIAGSDLIPELHKDEDMNLKKASLQILSFVLGIAVMMSLLFLE
ncbi:MAG: ZIP family metal transporter [bacterium]|nr:ZIP family metal transporter [bacterium]